MTSRWDGFSEQELRTIYNCIGRLNQTQMGLNLTEELRQYLQSRLDRAYKPKATVTGDALAVATEALRVSGLGAMSQGTIARRSETSALRDAVRAIIKHLEQKP